MEGQTRNYKDGMEEGSTETVKEGGSEDTVTFHESQH